jgi:thiosulfate dehydrogenase (quinone) large subunit
MIKWLRSSNLAAGILLILRMYVGWEFLNAGWHKIIGPKPFSAEGFLKGAIAKSSGEHPIVQQWYADFIQEFALPNVDVFNFLVKWGEFLVGLGLILGTLTTFAALMGVFMNFNYLFAGTISTNPNLILAGFFLLAAGYNAGRFGGDYWVVPWIRKYMSLMYQAIKPKQIEQQA